MRGREYGEVCREDNACYSGRCSRRKCICFDAECAGCSNQNAPCFRIEQPNPNQELTLCEVDLVYTSKVAKPHKLFSFGGQFAHDLSRVNKLDVGGNVLCTTFKSFDPNSGHLPPSFAQMNVQTGDLSEIGRFVLRSGDDPFPLLDSILFLNGHWVKTVDFTDSAGDNLRTIDVTLWHRIEADNLEHFIAMLQDSTLKGKTIVLNVSGELILPDELIIPPGIGVDIVGIDGSDPILVLGQRVLVLGRASFKDLVIDFETAVFDIQGSVIYQGCGIVNINRCPVRFREFGDLCLRASPFLEPVEEAETICEEYGGSWIGEVDLTDPAVVGEELLRPGDEAWLRPQMTSATRWLRTRMYSGASEPACASTLNANGVLNRDLKDCDGFKRVLCSVSVKKSIVGRNYTSYFTDQTIPNAVSVFTSRRQLKSSFS